MNINKRILGNPISIDGIMIPSIYNYSRPVISAKSLEKNWLDDLGEWFFNRIPDDVAKFVPDKIIDKVLETAVHNIGTEEGKVVYGAINTTLETIENIGNKTNDFVSDVKQTLSDIIQQIIKKLPWDWIIFGFVIFIVIIKN